MNVVVVGEIHSIAIRRIENTEELCDDVVVGGVLEDGEHRWTHTGKI